jgi:very-short-patch-repair endonuclease
MNLRLKKKRDIMIALMNNKRDFEIAKNDRWYRIPLKTKITPDCVTKGFLKTIAFYQSKTFGPRKYMVEWKAEVRNIEIVKRSELFPDEKANPKTKNEYYKINFSALEPIQPPIVSRRPRRILFIPTNEDQFRQAREINELFYESPLEERIWDALRTEKIEAERQYFVSKSRRHFYLDFALFCRNSNLAIECDGDRYHMKRDAVLYDKRRDNILESMGWNVLRYTTKDIVYNLDESIAQIKETINKYGGLVDPEGNPLKYFDSDDSQISLFE